MKKQTHLFIDQWGNKFYAKTVKELRAQIPGRCQRIFIDKKAGPPVCTGYVIGPHWLTRYAPVESPS